MSLDAHFDAPHASNLRTPTNARASEMAYLPIDPSAAWDLHHKKTHTEEAFGATANFLYLYKFYRNFPSYDCDSCIIWMRSFANKWHCHKFNVSLFAHFHLAFCHYSHLFAKRRTYTQQRARHIVCPCSPCSFSLSLPLKLKLNVRFSSFAHFCSLFHRVRIVVSVRHKQTFAHSASVGNESKKGKRE